MKKIIVSQRADGHYAYSEDVDDVANCEQGLTVGDAVVNLIRKYPDVFDIEVEERRDIFKLSGAQ